MGAYAVHEDEPEEGLPLSGLVYRQRVSRLNFCERKRKVYLAYKVFGLEWDYKIEHLTRWEFLIVIVCIPTTGERQRIYIRLPIRNNSSSINIHWNHLNPRIIPAQLPNPNAKC